LNRLFLNGCDCHTPDYTSIMRTMMKKKPRLVKSRSFAGRLLLRADRRPYDRHDPQWSDDKAKPAEDIDQLCMAEISLLGNSSRQHAKDDENRDERDSEDDRDGKAFDDDRNRHPVRS
jgi:hypothetical protein